jgi:RNA polymerase sigma-70 factor (ECF subfamily)
MIDGFMDLFRHLERILRRRGRSREDAEDLIQETFLRVKKYLDEGGEIHEPEAFLVRTALNLSRDSLQHEHRHLYAQTPLEDMLLVDTGPGPDEVFETEERIGRLDRALNKAGPRAREVFVMHRLYGMTYLQIADHFDISVSAIEKHIAKALMVLGEELLE